MSGLAGCAAGGSRCKLAALSSGPAEPPTCTPACCCTRRPTPRACAVLTLPADPDCAPLLGAGAAALCALRPCEFFCFGYLYF